MKNVIVFASLLCAVFYDSFAAACDGIAAGLKEIQIAAGVSTGVSGVGTLTGAAAVATGMMKSNVDKSIGELESMTSLQLLEYAQELGKNAAALKAEKDQLQKKSQSLGNIRTGMAGATAATSGVSAVSAGISVDKIGKLIDKMTECNQELERLELVQMQYRMEGKDESDQEVARVGRIMTNCKKFNIGNMTAIKKQMTASTIISGVGVAAGLTGAITSAIAVGKEKNGASAVGLEGRESTKGLNIAANISSGIATATSIGSLALGAITLSKLNADAENAKNCKNAF
jgi:hypothetical protein